MAALSRSERWTDRALVVVALAIFTLAILGGLPRLQNDPAIRIATALLPPQMHNDGSGREAEIITQALRAGGVSEAQPIEFHVMPFTRHWQIFKSDRDRRYHAVTTVPESIDLEGVRSDVYIHYQNGAIYRTADFPNGLGVDPIGALADRRIVAFAGAATILPAMRRASTLARVYLERGDQYSHSVMFAKGTVDAVVADELIFTHYTREVLGEQYAEFLRSSVFDPIFAPTPYQMVFRDNKLQEAFNAGLAQIRASGVLEKINAKYAQQAAIKKVQRAVGGR